MKTIAVDVDDVLAINVPAFLEFSNKRWGTKLTMEDYLEDWPTMWQIDRDTLRQRVKVLDDEKLSSTYKSNDHAVGVLERLKGDYRLVITTSRRKELIRETSDWIDQYFPNIFDETHHTGIFDELHSDAHLVTKAELCKQVGADYLIDDQPKHCFAVADAGITALLFGVYPWNRNTEPHEKVIHVKDWQKVAKYFNV